MKATNLPTAYAMIYFHMAARARELGYALALHGSLTRDLDMVAIPWVEEAASVNELATALIETSGGIVINDESADPFDFTKRNPQPKPHGRLGWSIQLGGGLYIDLSVMPTAARGENESEVG